MTTDYRDVPTGLLEKYRTGQLRRGKRYKAVTLNVFVSKLQDLPRPCSP